jgi:calpain-15
VWKRIKDVYGDGTYSLFGSNGVTPKDIYQGSIGNCWFMSALSAIAEKPNRVESMFLNNQIEPTGVYGVNLYALGVPHTVLVDDFIPGYDWND